MSDASLTRFEFDGTVVHENGLQFVDGAGFAADAFAKVHRPESHGFASVPVKGGLGAVFQSRASRDSAYAFGGENPSLRPALPGGGTALYDHKGNIIKLIGDEAVFDFQTRTAKFNAGQWNIAGNVTITGTLHVTGDITTDATNPNKHTH